MGRTFNSGLSIGAYGQVSLENYELMNFLNEQKKSENKKGIKGPDFYVGPNGKILSAQYKRWIGVSRRSEFMRKTKNTSLKNMVDQLYRPGAFIGDGGTASVVLFEKRTGLNLGKNGGTHVKKAKDMITHIEKKVLTQKLSPGDRKLANKFVKDLKKALVK